MFATHTLRERAPLPVTDYCKVCYMDACGRLSDGAFFFYLFGALEKKNYALHGVVDSFTTGLNST